MRKQVWLTGVAAAVVSVLNPVPMYPASVIVQRRPVSANGAGTGSNANAEKTPTTGIINARHNSAGRSVIRIIGVSTASVMLSIVSVTANSNNDVINSGVSSPAKRTIRVRKPRRRAGLQRWTRQSRILLFPQALTT